MESVQVIESCFLVPREVTPTKELWLSPLDLVIANAGHGPLVCLYRSGATFFDVPRLKVALAKALVAFYPLAGRLGVDDNGRVQIRCNGKGTLFVVARTHLAAEDVDFSKPSALLKRMFVPTIEPACLILATQVTFLRCGTVVLGLSIHHAAADCISTSHFMQTWSAMYRDHGDRTAAANELPCHEHDHTLLRAWSSHVVQPDALSVLYYPKLVTYVTEVFPISRDQLVKLKRRICSGGRAAATASTFVSLSALLWQCMCVVRRLPPDAIIRLSIPINLRRNMLPTNYFGNAMVTLCATGVARDITSEALPSVAARITRAMATMDEELVRSAIDYAELAYKDTMPERGNLQETDLRIVSWLKMPLGLDLGSGGPEVITPADTIAHGCVYLIDNYGPANHGGVSVVLRMEAANIMEFERLLYAGIKALALARNGVLACYQRQAYRSSL